MSVSSSMMSNHVGSVGETYNQLPQSYYIAAGPSTSSSNSSRSPQFCCPVAKYGGHRHCPGFSRISDIRQHIIRKHLQILHCPTCYVTFEGRNAESHRAQHISQNTCWYAGNLVHYPGATYTQIEAMNRFAENRSRRSKTVRWNEIRSCLFPETEYTEDVFVHVTDSRHDMLMHGYLQSQMMFDFLARVEAEQQLYSPKCFRDYFMEGIQNFCTYARNQEDIIEPQHSRLLTATDHLRPQGLVSPGTPFQQSQSQYVQGTNIGAMPFGMYSGPVLEYVDGVGDGQGAVFGAAWNNQN